MCYVLGVPASGFYAWLKQPLSKREREDQYLLGFIKQFWLESGAVYGYRKSTTISSQSANCAAVTVCTG